MTEIKMNIQATRQYAQDIMNACDAYEASVKKSTTKGGKKANAE